MQNIKKHHPTEADIKNLIEGIVKSEYEVRGYTNDNFSIRIKSGEVINLEINTENPFLGKEFWNFLEVVTNRINEAVRDFGYVYKKTWYFFDYCIIDYVFKIE